MYKFGKSKTSDKQSLRFQIRIAAFLLGTCAGYYIAGDRLPTEQMVSLGEQVRMVLFAGSQPVKKDG